MPENCLERNQVASGFQKSRRKSMAKILEPEMVNLAATDRAGMRGF
jgi:hypothetical protein